MEKVNTAKKHLRNRKRKEKKEEDPEFLRIGQILSISWAIVMGFAFLVFLIRPASNNLWYAALFFILFSLSSMITGILLGWISWFKGDKVKAAAARTVPKLRAQYGLFSEFFYFFIPDRYVPTYVLWMGRYVSAVCIFGAFSIFKQLLDML